MDEAADAAKESSAEVPALEKMRSALLAFHLTLVYHPQDARVVWRLCSILYHGTWRKAAAFAAESLKDHVQFSPEISVCSSPKSAKSLLEATSHFASLIQKSLKMLTSVDEVFQCLVKRSDQVPCVGLVFVSPQTGNRLHKLFNVLATDIRSYDMARKTSAIDYDLLKNGDLSETRFVLGKVIMDTMEGEHALAHEQSLETKAKKSSLLDLTCEEDNNLIVEESRTDKLTQQNNQNVLPGKRSQFIEIIDEWNKKVPAARRRGNHGEKKQNFDSEKDIDEPSGKKKQKVVVTEKGPSVKEKQKMVVRKKGPQKMVVTEKGRNHSGEHDRKNGEASSKQIRLSNIKPSAENRICKISGEKNQKFVAKEKIDGKVSENVRPVKKQNLKATSVEKRRPLSALFK